MHTQVGYGQGDWGLGWTRVPAPQGFAISKSVKMGKLVLLGIGGAREMEIIVIRRKREHVILAVMAENLLLFKLFIWLVEMFTQNVYIQRFPFWVVNIF